MLFFAPYGRLDFLVTKYSGPFCLRSAHCFVWCPRSKRTWKRKIQPHLEKNVRNPEHSKQRLVKQGWTHPNTANKDTVPVSSSPRSCVLVGNIASLCWGGSGSGVVHCDNNDHHNDNKAPFTQDAEVLANVACKKMEHIVACWSVHTALLARSKDLHANLHKNGGFSQWAASLVKATWPEK